MMSRFANIADLHRAARRKLPPFLMDYIDGGSFAEETLGRNTRDFQTLSLRQRVLRDVSNIDMSTAFFGTPASMPLVLAPLGLAGMNARRGEVQAFRAATEAGVPFSLSTLSVCPLAEVCEASSAAPWLQLYMIKDRGFMRDFLAEGSRRGLSVLLLTVDLAVPGTRYRDHRSGLSRPATFATQMRRIYETVTHPHWAWDVGLKGRPHVLGNIAPIVGEQSTLAAFWGWVAKNFDPAVTWDDIAWVRENWPGRLVLKGILDPDDAARAAALGMDGVVVSNHGGRQLDGAPSTITALPAIVAAIEGRATILLDGGVRTGVDLFRALACGAQGVLVGRPWAWALAAGGQAGVARMLEIFSAEFGVAMALTGCASISEIDCSTLSDTSSDRTSN